MIHGTMIKNFLRSWTDMGLNDLWPCVLMSAAGKGGKP